MDNNESLYHQCINMAKNNPRALRVAAILKEHTLDDEVIAASILYNMSPGAHSHNTMFSVHAIGLVKELREDMAIFTLSPDALTIKLACMLYEQEERRHNLDNLALYGNTLNMTQSSLIKELSL